MSSNYYRVIPLTYTGRVSYSNIELVDIYPGFSKSSEAGALPTKFDSRKFFKIKKKTRRYAIKLSLLTDPGPKFRRNLPSGRQRTKSFHCNRTALVVIHVESLLSTCRYLPIKYTH
eukprot:SAG11_NODE_1561_length_4677_cov_2.447138_1_plen_116_part_00